VAGNLQRRRPADRVVLAMLEELQRQRSAQGMTFVGMIDLHGRVQVDGWLDLAALAHATEFALTTAFPGVADAVIARRPAQSGGA
jgi:hypothetical protein